MNDALLDTDILSFYFRGDNNVVEHVTEYLQSNSSLNISIITYYEIVGGLKYKRAKKQLLDFEQFVNSNNIFFISEESANIAGDIYADLRLRGTNIGTSDILIAGIALANDLTLITNNEKHYKPIKGLNIENWKK